MSGRKAALLDRDGTLNVDHGYVGDPAAVELLPDVAAGLRRLADDGYALVVVTNQSGVDRGYFAMRDVDAVHERLSGVLAAEGVEIAGYYVCPHGVDTGCDCRKPRTGLAERAARELGLDLEGSLVIGDKESDVEMGLGVGAWSVRLAPPGTASRAHLVAPDWRTLMSALDSLWASQPLLAQD